MHLARWKFQMAMGKVEGYKSFLVMSELISASKEKDRYRWKDTYECTLTLDISVFR
ncbi:hypothetical protein LOAG_05674 [Loa loa]|uniref:Uncharacterized protein n=1 Tax=Loa loa TaxID=7209 RepID=A0A1S0U140_LOALO|nr:hypothetical protein LOAG_05674 [Loa loa]EFO22816.1 hypothetical protein LOAG_05674 [Loa loa]